MYRPVSAAAGKNIVFGIKTNFLSWTPQFGKSGMLGYDETIVVASVFVARQRTNLYGVYLVIFYRFFHSFW